MKKSLILKLSLTFGLSTAVISSAILAITKSQAENSCY